MTRKPGFTLVEIVTVVAIILVLLAILLPALGVAMRRGREAKCHMQMVQINQAVTAYRQDKNEYPEIDDPMNTLVGAKLLPAIPTCPGDPKKGHDTYGALYNYWGYALITTPQQPFPVRLQSLDEAKAVYEPLMNTTGCKYWRTTGYDYDFPGLANSTAPGKTIVTLCPFHAANKGRFVILRKDGTIDFSTPISTDPEFWTLSKMGK